MDILTIAIALFLLLESSNVLILYFKPDFPYGNGVGVFKAWEKSKQDPEVHALVRYLVNWVAGTKLIFILLLVVILVTGSPMTRAGAVGALILSILSFWWRLFPAIRRMDRDGQIEPRGYSRTLGIMIGSFIVVFSLALTLWLILG